MFIYFIWQTITFRITKVSPGGKSISIDNIYLEVSFNMDIKQNAKISSTDDIVKDITYEKDKLKLKLGQLTENKEYTIVFEEVYSNSGKVLNKTHRFIAKNIPFDSLSKSEQKILINNQDQDITTTDPILAHLPYGGIGFSLKAIPEDNHKDDSRIKVHADILLSRADMDEYEEAQKRYKQDVKDYFKSINLDINNYTIDYTIVEPSIY